MADIDRRNTLSTFPGIQVLGWSPVITPVFQIWQARSFPALNWDSSHDIINKAKPDYVNFVFWNDPTTKVSFRVGVFLVLLYLGSSIFCEEVTARTPYSDITATNANPEDSLQIYSWRRLHTAKLITYGTHPKTSWIETSAKIQPVFWAMRL